MKRKYQERLLSPEQGKETGFSEAERRKMDQQR